MQNTREAVIKEMRHDALAKNRGITEMRPRFLLVKHVERYFAVASEKRRNINTVNRFRRRFRILLIPPAFAMPQWVEQL